MRQEDKIYMMIFAAVVLGLLICSVLLFVPNSWPASITRPAFFAGLILAGMGLIAAALNKAPENF